MRRRYAPPQTSAAALRAAADKLTAFEKENTWRANKQILRKTKKKYDQKSYINIKEMIEKYAQEYVALYTKYKPEFAEAIVQKFKFMGN